MEYTPLWVDFSLLSGSGHNRLCTYRIEPPLDVVGCIQVYLISLIHTFVRIDRLGHALPTVV